MGKIICLFFISLNAIFIKAQTSIKTWSGILNAGPQKIELRLLLKEETDLQSAWDVPAQNAFGIPSSKTEWLGKKLMIEIKAIGSSFQGVLNEEGNKIEGNWSQGGGVFPLVLTPFVKEIQPAQLDKPQTPKPPFSYISKDYVYEGISTKLTYGATLTYPNEHSKFPLIILITGSGKQDRDESILNHKPFFVMADYLTRNGFAVLRVDDRGAGKSTGDFANSTSEDFSKDVEEHLLFAKSLPMVKVDKIGLLGHSEGGLIAPLVASVNKSVSFLILMAGPGVKIVDLMVQQNEAIFKSSGMEQKDIDSYLPLYKNLLIELTGSANKNDAFAKAKERITLWYNEVDKEAAKKMTGITSTEQINPFALTMVNQIYTPWWKFFANYDPVPVLEKVKCPVLAINGSADIQVLADPNLSGIEKALAKGGNKKFTIKKFDQLNHLFQKCKDCTVTEYGSLETTIEPEVLSYLSDWLKKQLN